jgi:hypothetical protein
MITETNWSGRGDSNSRSPAPKAGALATTLRPEAQGWSLNQISHSDYRPSTFSPYTCGCSSMVEPQPSKLAMPVRSRSPAPDCLSDRSNLVNEGLSREIKHVTAGCPKLIDCSKFQSCCCGANNFSNNHELVVPSAKTIHECVHV